MRIKGKNFTIALKYNLYRLLFNQFNPSNSEFLKKIQRGVKTAGHFQGGTGNLPVVAGYQPAAGFGRQVAAQNGLVARSTHHTGSLQIRPVLRLPIGRRSHRVGHKSSEPSQNKPHVAY
jgi:hypothetical protein